MKDGTRMATYERMPRPPRPGRACIVELRACHPPAAARPKGTASTNPANLTLSCIRLTQAELSKPPAAKYALTTIPPIKQPCHLGVPMTISRICEIAMSCPARIIKVPIQSMTAMSPRTERLYRWSRKSPTVRQLFLAARVQIFGPTVFAKMNDPIPADPTHHQALQPKA